jgi:hypothetical protein
MSAASQTVVYVSSKSDKRLLAYQDSLNAHLRNEQRKKEDLAIISDLVGHDKFIVLMRRFGFKPNREFPEHIWDNKKVSGQKTELFYCCEHCMCFYRVVVPKPVVKVIYRPTVAATVPTTRAPTTPAKSSDNTSRVHVIYKTVDIKGSETVDSTKIVKVTE